MPVSKSHPDRPWRGLFKRAAPRRPRHNGEGFSLIELLVVMAIISVLVGTLLPALGAARGYARAVKCKGQLHDLGLATMMGLNDHEGVFWRYYVDTASGRWWWFGFEAGGPGPPGTPNRPLDMSKGVLGPYMEADGDKLQCPDFPYDDPDFFHKFERRSASFGFNLLLGPASAAASPKTIDSLSDRYSEVFVFADGIHFDGISSPTDFNEGHYIAQSNTAFKSGYAHFRHRRQANYVLLDGHVASQERTGGSYRTVGGGAAGNLTARDGSNKIYGY